MTAKARADLEAGLASGAPVWVRAAEAGLPVPGLDTLARARGYAVARVFGAPADPVVLLSPWPVHRLAELAGPADRSAMRTIQLRYTAGIPLSVVPLVAVLAGFGTARAGLPVALAVLAGLALMALGGYFGWRWMRRVARRDLSSRMRLLIAEFGGGPVTVVATQLRIDPAVVVAVAAELGYRLVRTRQGWTSVPALAEVWLSFVPAHGRNPL